MKKSPKEAVVTWQSADTVAREELDRINARLRHFRGIAAGVMHDATLLLEEIWDSCQDPRTWQEILDGIPEPEARTPTGGWAEFHEKLHLLGIYLDYAKRLCEGSLDDPRKSEREVESCPLNSKSSQTLTDANWIRSCPPKKICGNSKE
ncbi:MAG: hypothetical protein FJ135_02585 [Deltaproteobacteria bacterium]|nr:hypothetical protein [Deltaproteobacteria bacterium]